jgi:protein CMS1
LAETIEAVEGSITDRPPHELSRYLNIMQSKCFPDLSVVEMDDLRIPGTPMRERTNVQVQINLQIETSIADTTSWTGPRSLDQLVDFIMKSKQSPSLSPLRFHLGICHSSS